jgi:hypothetical protein
MNYFLPIPVVLLILLLGCLQNETVCNKPYIHIGDNCCLDYNEDNICDKYELTIPPQTMPSTTTLLIKSQPNCTKPYIEYKNEDCCLDSNNNHICDKYESTINTSIEYCTSEPFSCGEPIKVDICYEQFICTVTDIPLCRNPDTPESYCYIKRIGPTQNGRLVDCNIKCDFGCDPNTVKCRPAPI